MSKETLEVLARMTDTEIQIKDVVSDWLLITYDLPNTEEGNKARFAFLKQAKQIGATRHTDSVYLMPWTPTAEGLALQLSRAQGGDVVLWTSRTLEEDQNRVITAMYDASLTPQLKELSERIDRIWENKTHNREKTAQKMIPKTTRMLNNLEEAIRRRGSQTLWIRIELIAERFRKVVNG